MASVGEDMVVLAEQVGALFRRTAAAEQLVARLRESDGSTPNVPALTAEIQRAIADLGHDAAALRRRADDQDRELDGAILREKLHRHAELRDNLVRGFREAVLQARANAERSHAAKRDELLGDAVATRAQRQERTAEALRRTAEDVTRSIQRTTQLLHVEVERSAQAYRTLNESTQKLAATGAEHRTLGGTLGTAKTVLTQLFARERADRVLVVVALLVFVLTVVYIVKGRLFPSAAAPAPPPAPSALNLRWLWSLAFGSDVPAAADAAGTGAGRDEL